MSDVARLDRLDAAVRALPRGSAVVLRHTDPEKLLSIAGALARLCRSLGLRCLIAGDWRIAARVGADGVHLPERRLQAGRLAPVLGWRRGRGSLITAAAHSARAVATARRLGLDAAVLAPVFPTGSHPDGRALGAARAALIVRTAHVPVIVLGGVSPATIVRARAIAPYGVAAIAALMPSRG